MYDRIDGSERININRPNKSSKYIICNLLLFKIKF